ncbi:MAG: phospholipase D-like domain-containing protein [Thermodesulfovibrionia bacterium]|nr:phospholipase D-like domain-containing protein [Thermodesulfovibrionia bacterium]
MPESSLVDSFSPPNEFSQKKSFIEEILRIPFTENNYIRILENGEEIFQTILNSVSSARKIIFIEFYLFKDDDTGNTLAELLKEKSREGVTVYLLYDHFGSLLTSKDFWSELKKAGIKYHVSHPFKLFSPRRYIYRNHKKLLIVDGEKAFTGGFNIADEYHGFIKKKQKTWRDIGIYLEGPIVHSLSELFMKSWRRWKGIPIEFDSKTEYSMTGIQAIPIFASTGRARRRMRRLLIQSIKNSKNNIYITTAYFLPSRKLFEALEHAAKRGVLITLLLPGKSDIKSVYYASRAYYSKLLSAGVRIYNYQGTVLHAKTAVFDGIWSIVGSTNLDFQSLSRNDESNVGILDKSFSSKMIEVFNNDLQQSTKIIGDTWANRPFHQKILEKVFSFILKQI